ncbi:MAG: enoyl-CoA hydratase-related protein [Bacteroidota bacterium]
MKYVQIEFDNKIGVITINRPDKRNALNEVLVNELKAAFYQLEKEDEVKVIILRAEGTVFSAGADLQYLKELQEYTYEENLADSNNLKDLFLLIYNLKKVVIAEVQGHAIAGGCGLMTVCDFAFTVPEAKFGYTEVKIGFIPALVSVFLIRKLSEAHARNLLLSGDLISASRAAEIGLVTEVVEPGDLTNYVKSFALNLVEKNSANSMSLTKQLIQDVQNMSLNDALGFAADQNAWVRESDDCCKGIESFLKGKKVTW